MNQRSLSLTVVFGLLAVVAAVDYLLTWNVTHLANPNKVLHLNAVCMEHGYIAPRILRPDDLQEMER